MASGRGSERPAVADRLARPRQVYRVVRRRPNGAASRRLVILVAALGLLVVAAAAAYFTLPSWYQTWMPSSLGRLGFPLRYTADIRAAAQRNDLDPALVAAVIYVESRYDQSVQSRRGAVGLMQVLPSTALEIARKSGGIDFVVSDLDTPRINILYGCFYLRRLMDHFGGSLVDTLAAYNAGEANVDQWLRDAGGTLSTARIPFAETRAYVRKVLRVRAIYRHVYGAQLGT
jgi:soluble lytic murein transglycosylase